MGHGKALFRVLFFEFAHADQDIRGRYLERESVQPLSPDAVQVRIPRWPRPDVVAPAACVVQLFVPAVFHGDRIDLPHRWSFIEDRIEGTVLLSVFLNEMQLLSSLPGYARDA